MVESGFAWAMVALAAVVTLLLWPYLQSGGNDARLGNNARPLVSILLIMRNQEDVVEELVRWLVASIGRSNGPFEFELVAVDAGSTDDTPAILSRLGYQYPSLRCLRWGGRTTDGRPPTEALELGYAACRSPNVFAIDLSTPANVTTARAALRSLLGGRNFDFVPNEQQLTG